MVVRLRGDFFFHNVLAEHIFLGAGGNFPHYLYHLVYALLFRGLLGCSIPVASTLTVVLFQTFAAVIIFLELLRSPRNGSPSVKLAISVSLFLVGPILLSFDSAIYFGYLHPNTYHNPTILVLTPLALLIFFRTIKFFSQKKQEWNAIVLIGCMSLAALSCIAKQSFAMIWLPSVVIMALVLCRFSRQKFECVSNWGMPLAVMALPQLIIVFAQAYSFGIMRDNRGSGILWAPFQVAALHSDFLACKFLSSIAFPVSVFLAIGRKVEYTLEFYFAWLLFIFAVLLYFLLAESGERFAHGNFYWSVQISLFILFFVAVRCLLSETCSHATKGISTTFCWCLYGLHLVSGIIFYLSHFFLTPEVAIYF